ncbi:MAG: PAS domain S-box protein, partial [Dehalococcoidales bacterium]|nr:PAS domain S-box protein [Dehalococcoidales bacterium]
MVNWIIGIPLITLFTSAGLAITIIPSTRRESSRFTLNLLLVLITLWSFCSFMFHSISSPNSLFWMFLILICAQLTGAVGVHFSVQFSEQTRAIAKWTVIAFYILALAVILLLFSGTIVKEATLLPNGAVEVSFGAMAPLVWGSIGLGILTAITILVTTLLTSSSQTKKYTIFTMLGFLVMCLGALSNMFLSSYPVDIAANFIFISLVSYGVVGKNIVRQTHLLPLRFSLPLAMSILILCYTAIFIFFLKWIELATSTSHLMAAIIIMIFGVIAFGPSRIVLSNRLKLLFFPDMYRYQRALNDLRHVDRSLMKWTNSITNILNIIAKATYADDAILLIPNSRATHFEAKFAIGPRQASILPLQLPGDSALVKALTNSSTALRAGDISQQTIMKVLIRGRDNNLEEINLTMCCGVRGANELLAIVGLIHKSPRYAERVEIKDFLEMACHEIATLIINVKLYEESQHEITERKRMAKALQESEQRYRQLFEGISDAVMVFSPQLKFLDCNEVTLQKLGYSREEFLSLDLTDIVHPDFRKAMDKHLQELRDGTDIMIESMCQGKDGSVIPVEINSHRIEYKGRPAVLAVVRDITERKQAEELFKTMANSSTAGVYIVQNRKFVLMNPQFQKLVGFTEDELLGTDPLSLVHPEDREATRDFAVQMLKGNRTSPYE